MKKRHVLIIFILVAMVGSALLVYKKYKKQPEPAPIEKVSLEETVERIDEAFKAGLLLSVDGQVEQAAEVAPRSLQAWENFVNAFKNKQPEIYNQSRDWEDKLLTILEHQRKADELFKEGNLNEAQVELEQSRLIFKEIKEENNILEISDELLAFYAEIKVITAAKNKNEVAANLNNLKLRFTILKEVNIDKNYSQLMVRLENIIRDLDRLLDGPEFRKAQKELMPTFMELYQKY